MLKSYLKHDIYKCFLTHYIYYILFALFILLLCYPYINYSESPTYIDLILYMDKGNPITNQEELNKIPIPYEWLIINITIVFLPVSYVYYDFGSTNMIRYSSRRKWIINKNIFCILEVLFLSFIKYMMPLFYCICRKCRLSTEVSQDLKSLILFFKSDITITDIFCNIFLLPLITLISITLLGVLISIVFNNITAYISVIFIYILSIISESPGIIGNYLMLRRNGVLSINNDPKYYYFNEAICIVSTIAVLVFCINLIIIRRVNPNKKAEL